MSKDALVFAQFVGGPIHGDCRWIRHGTELYEHCTSTGHVAVYKLRPAPKGVDWGAQIYAPVGMAESVYLDQFATLPRPAPNGALD